MNSQHRQWQEPYSKNIQIRSFNMRYYEWPGDGPTVILLHPSSGFGRMWDWVVEELGGAFHIFAPDQRCHGDSGLPSGPHSGEAYADDLHEFIDQLGFTRVHLIGHSLGGRAVQIYAARYPERVASIICSGGPHYISFFDDNDKEIDCREKVREMSERKNSFESRIAAAESLRIAKPQYSNEMVHHIIQHNIRDNTDGSVSFKYDTAAVSEGLSHIPDKLNAYAERVACPVLFLRGKQSTDLTRENVEEIAPLYRNCTIWEIDGDYTLQLENPLDAARCYKDFILTHP